MTLTIALIKAWILLHRRMQKLFTLAIAYAIMLSSISYEVSDMEFSEKIKYVREKLDMSQEDLARALNVSFSTINRWENEKTKPIKMAKAVFETFCENRGIVFPETR